MTAAQDSVKKGLLKAFDITSSDPALASSDIYSVFDQVLPVATSILGVIALLALIWAGFVYMTAVGDESRISQAKKTALWAVVGLILAALAYAILTLVVSIFGPETT